MELFIQLMDCPYENDAKPLNRFTPVTDLAALEVGSIVAIVAKEPITNTVYPRYAYWSGDAGHPLSVTLSPVYPFTCSGRSFGGLLAIPDAMMDFIRVRKMDATSGIPLFKLEGEFLDGYACRPARTIDMSNPQHITTGSRFMDAYDNPMPITDDPMVITDDSMVITDDSMVIADDPAISQPPAKRRVEL